MPNIATVLKQEITRLARKEVNAGTKVIRKSNAQYRRDIAQVKRQVAALSKQVAYLEGRERKRASKGAPEASTAPTLSSYPGHDMTDSNVAAQPAGKQAPLERPVRARSDGPTLAEIP